MCDTCNYISFNIRLDKLTEDLIYDAFDDLVAKGKVIDKGLIDHNSPKRTTEFVCNECQSSWFFTCPDHAFKGKLVRVG